MTYNCFSEFFWHKWKDIDKSTQVKVLGHGLSVSNLKLSIFIDFIISVGFEKSYNQSISMN